MTDLCHSCGKTKLAGQAGSITSHFFQYKYCQCQNEKYDVAGAKNLDNSKKSNSSPNRICLNCGKSRPENQKPGSFTAYLFKELRCQCSNPRFKRTNKITRRTESAERLDIKRVSSKSSLNITAGTIIGGTFKIISLIGRGGMGTIYLAEHLTLQRKFALKVLAPDLIDEQYWQRFKAEAKTLSALNHPNLVNVYDLGVDQNSIFYYSMDYLQGQNLEEILAREGPLGLDRTINIYLAVLDALSYAHRNGIVHRDIKPANIFVCHEQTTVKGGEIKVLDFGIAKLLKSAGENQNLTAAGEVFGSPYYMSPEQCSGGEVDARCDIYATGCAIFETLSGYVPYEAESSIEIALMHEEEELPHLADFTDRELPPAMDRVIRKCLAKLPRDRYQSARALAIDLERVQSGREVLIETVPENSRVGRNFSGLLSGLLAILAAATIGGACYWAWPHLTQTVTQKTAMSAEVKQASSELDQTSSLSLPGADVEADNMLKAKTHDYLTGVKVVGGKQNKVFLFPTNFTLGDFSYIDETGSYSKPAQGECLIPIALRPVLKTADIVAEKPGLLDLFHPDDLGGLDMDNVDMKSLRPHLQRFPDLRNLSLVSMNVQDEDTDTFGIFKNLDTFILRNTRKISGEKLAQWQLLRKVSQLELGTACDHITPVLHVLTGNHKLKNLTLSTMGLSKEDFALIASLPYLKILQINDTVITAANMRQLSSIAELETLNVERCPEADLSWLDGLKKLKHLKNLKLPLSKGNPLIRKIYIELPKISLTVSDRIVAENHLQR